MFTASASIIPPQPSGQSRTRLVQIADTRESLHTPTFPSGHHGGRLTRAVNGPAMCYYRVTSREAFDCGSPLTHWRSNQQSNAILRTLHVGSERFDALHLTDY